MFVRKMKDPKIDSTQQAFKCEKCDKEYLNLSKLRRHDWRCHKQIECNMCGEKTKQKKQY